MVSYWADFLMNNDKPEEEEEEAEFIDACREYMRDDITLDKFSRIRNSHIADYRKASLEIARMSSPKKKGLFSIFRSLFQ